MTRSTNAVIIGAGGGIGAALVRELHASRRYARIHALSRTPVPEDDTVLPGFIDVTSEPSIAAAAERIGAPIDLLMVATGILHESGRMPERALRDLDGGILQRLFAVNTIGPALVLKHFAPLLAKDSRAVIACLSARIGSVSDNRSGGWYAYRASKAALNMIVKSAAIELGRTRPLALCVALHPGTVDTGLSQPFQARVPADKLFSPEQSACHLLAVLDNLKHTDSGRIFAWDGREIAP